MLDQVRGEGLLPGSVVIPEAGYGVAQPFREGLAQFLSRRKVTWREATKGKPSGKCGWVWVWPAQGWERDECAFAEPLRRLIEEQAEGRVQFASSNPPTGDP